MSEPHTADLGTRYRYRQEGAEAERERIVRLLSELAAETHKLTLFKPNKSEDINRQKLAAVCYHLIELIKGEQK